MAKKTKKHKVVYVVWVPGEALPFGVYSKLDKAVNAIETTPTAKEMILEGYEIDYRVTHGLDRAGDGR